MQRNDEGTRAATWVPSVSDADAVDLIAITLNHDACPDYPDANWQNNADIYMRLAREIVGTLEAADLMVVRQVRGLTLQAWDRAGRPGFDAFMRDLDAFRATRTAQARAAAHEAIVPSVEGKQVP